MRMFRVIVLLGFGIGSVAAVAETQFESDVQQVTLLELYTSEGCSSCPRADAWLRDLKNRNDLWKSFVPVAFHVDYWDYLGWQDKFGRRQFSERQRAYGDKWNAGSIYTPEFVVNGAEWRGWLKSKSSPQKSSETVGKLRAIVGADGRVSIEYKPTHPSTKAVIARIAFLGFDRSSQVSAGENSGSRLVHDFVVEALKEIELNDEKGRLRAETNLTIPAKGPGQTAVAIWVEQKGDPTPLQATGGWLEEP